MLCFRRTMLSRGSFPLVLCGSRLLRTRRISVNRRTNQLCFFSNIRMRSAPDVLARAYFARGDLEVEALTLHRDLLTCEITRLAAYAGNLLLI